MIAVVAKLAGMAIPILKGWRGTIIAVVAVILVASSIIWYQGRQIDAGLAQIETLHDRLTSAQSELMLMRDNRDRLAESLARQTEQIRALEQAAITASRRADAAAQVVIQEAETYRESDAAIGPDPQDMNLWLRNIFNY